MRVLFILLEGKGESFLDYVKIFQSLLSAQAEVSLGKEGYMSWLETG